MDDKESSSEAQQEHQGDGQRQDQESCTPPKEEEAAKDEEGLLLEYDVIVCGTGLVQAILASALARAGKKVLHCDGDELYGELDAVWTLPMLCGEEAERRQRNDMVGSDLPSTAVPLSPKGGRASLRFHSTKKTTKFGITVGTCVETPYGTGVVKTLPNLEESPSSLAVALDQWNLADGTAPVSYFGISHGKNRDAVPVEDPLAFEEYLSENCQIYSLRSLQAQRLLSNEKARYLALDATPVFVLAAGRAVDGMLASNVADYLEFKSVEGLMWLEKEASLSRVPCSKNDVFSTKLLSPLDKRRLMKFLQLAMDYATKMSVAEELLKDQKRNRPQTDERDGELTGVASQENLSEAEVQSLNERHLNQGRSLARPQNKAVATSELQKLQKFMEQPNATFDDYLSSQHKLSPKLRGIIRYALSMETTHSSASLSQGMSQLRHHLQALGRYGTTAFLMPMYGSGELSQAFCRSAAVFGATYLLRRAPIGIELKKNESEGSSSVCGVVIAGDASDEMSNQKTKTIKCQQVVLPRGALRSRVNASEDSSNNSCATRIVRRISILNGKLLEGEQRHVIVIPPQSLSSNNTHSIHAITMDESVQVAPAGYTVLHLTTTIPLSNEEENDGIIAEEMLSEASQAIRKASCADTGNNTVMTDEIFSITYSHELSPFETTEKDPLVEGIHLCSHTGQVLTADVAFEQAERIFQKICPNQEFLGLSDELDAAIKERAAERGYEDEERLMLESALGMLGEDQDEAKDEEVMQLDTGKN